MCSISFFVLENQAGKIQKTFPPKKDTLETDHDQNELRLQRRAVGSQRKKFSYWPASFCTWAASGSRKSECSTTTASGRRGSSGIGWPRNNSNNIIIIIIKRRSRRNIKHKNKNKRNNIIIIIRNSGGWVLHRRQWCQQKHKNLGYCCYQ